MLGSSQSNSRVDDGEYLGFGNLHRINSVPQIHRISTPFEPATSYTSSLKELLPSARLRLVHLQCFMHFDMQLLRKVRCINMT